MSEFESRAQHMIEANARYANSVHVDHLLSSPSDKLAIVTCMDVRINPYAVLGIEAGQAHILRNAGGVITDDVIRSLCLSQRSLGTRQIVLIHHTDCGLEGLDEVTLRKELLELAGVEPEWSFHSFSDPFDDVRTSMKKLSADPFISHKGHIRGFVFDVTDGQLREVERD